MSWSNAGQRIAGLTLLSFAPFGIRLRKTRFAWGARGWPPARARKRPTRPDQELKLLSEDDKEPTSLRLRWRGALCASRAIWDGHTKRAAAVGSWREGCHYSTVDRAWSAAARRIVCTSLAHSCARLIPRIAGRARLCLWPLRGQARHQFRRYGSGARWAAIMAAMGCITNSPAPAWIFVMSVSNSADIVREPE